MGSNSHSGAENIVKRSGGLSQGAAVWFDCPAKNDTPVESVQAAFARSSFVPYTEPLLASVPGSGLPAVDEVSVWSGCMSPSSVSRSCSRYLPAGGCGPARSGVSSDAESGTSGSGSGSGCDLSGSGSGDPDVG